MEEEITVISLWFDFFELAFCNVILWGGWRERVRRRVVLRV